MKDRAIAGDEAEILLVEDNPGDVRLIEEAFHEGKIANTLHHASDGKEALDFVLQRGEYADANEPDIVLLDLDLPKIDGEEVLAEIKDDPELHRIPVVVLTGSEVQRDIVKSYDLDANAYLTKPVDSDEFIELIRSFDHFWLSLACLPHAEEV